MQRRRIHRWLLAECDWVVVSHFRGLVYHETWEEEGSDAFERVHTVYRGRGLYRTAVASVYRRRQTLDPAHQ